MKVLNRTVLIKVLRMMSSNHDGEALNAARIATKMLKDVGADWNDVIVAADAKIPQPVPQQRRVDPTGFRATFYGGNTSTTFTW